MHLGTRSLTLTVDGISRTADVSDCRIVSERIPDGERRFGGPIHQYRLRGTAAQDLSAGSLWDLIWEHVGEDVEVDLRPAGGTVASGDQPHFLGTVTIAESEGDVLGGPANPSLGARFTFDFDWLFTERPTRVVVP